MATGRCTSRHTRQDVAVLGVLRRRRPALLVSTALQAVAVLVLAAPARAQLAPNARPLGGQVVAGSAVISQPAGGTTTTITQSSARAALNWQGFNVGSQQTVQFAQPSASASTLNRVISPDPSQIAGRIVANGQVVLVNQSGVVFAKGAQVDVGGLVVSAAGITNQNFMAGALKFDQPAQPNARVVNRGQITIRQAGLAALVAPRVANSGVISAKLGHVILAGAETQTLDMYGDGLVAIDVTGEVRQVPVGADGKPATALVTNTGTVVAAGGTVLLTARAADGIVQNLVDAGGRIAAPTVGGHTGMIALQGVGGSILIAGQVEAVGTGAGERGGRIVANASDTVTLASGGALNASGRAGGGTVAFGTTLARATGGPSVAARRTARRAIVQPGAVIAADATANGAGGRVAVLSTEATAMGGAITARGGPAGGDGGFVEVSGRTGFALTGSVDVSAPLGNVGAILLDPSELDIVAGAGAPSNVDTTVPGVVSQTATPASITAAQIGVLGAADLTVTATDKLDVQTNVSVAKALTLKAGGLLVVENGVAIDAGGALVLSAGDALQLGTGTTPVTLSGDSVALGGTSITLNNASVTATNGVSLATAAGGVTQSVAGVINAASLTGNLVVGGASLNGANNNIPTLGTFGAPDGLTLVDSGPLQITGVVNAGPAATISAMGDLTVASGGALNAGTISLDAADIVIQGSLAAGAGGLDLIATSGSVTEAGSVVTLGSLSGVIGAGATLTGSNSIAALGNFLANDLTLKNHGALQITGPVTTSAATTITDTGQLTVDSSGILNAGAIGLTAGTITLQGVVNGDGGINLRAGSGGIALQSILNGGSKDVDLVTTTAGSVTESGIISAGTLTGSVAAGATLMALNAIGTLGPFTAADLALRDAVDLQLAGISNTGSAAVLADSGTLTVPSGALLQAGTVSLTAGSVTESGGITTALLTGSIVAGATLAGVNAIGTLGGFGAANLTLVNSPDLTVTGPVNAGSNATITEAETLTIGGLLNASVINLSAGALSENGGTLETALLTGSIAAGANLGGTNTITALGGFVASNLTLADTTDLQITGPVTAGAVSLAANNLTENGGAIDTALLSGSVVDNASLDGTNTIVALGGFTASTLALLDSRDLQVTGPVTAGTVSLTAPSLDIPGQLDGTISVSLVANTGGISELGTLLSPTLSGSAVLGASLLGAIPTANGVGTLNGFTVGTDFALDDGIPLTIGGAVTVGAGRSIALRTDALTIAAPVQVAGGTVAIAPATMGLDMSLGAGGTGPLSLGQADLGFIATGPTGTLVLGEIDAGHPIAQDLTIAGGVSIGVPVAGTLAFYPAGNIVEEPAGAVSVTNLTGSITGSANLDGANAVVTLGDFAANGFALNDTRDLLVGGVVDGQSAAAITDAGTMTIGGPMTGGPMTGGTVTAGMVDLTAQALAISGSVDGTTNVNLVANAGTIYEAGTLTTPGSLSGSATAMATLIGSNSIATLGNFAATNLVLDNTGSLTVAGVVNGGPSVVICDAGLLSISGAIDAAEVALSASGIGESGVIATPSLTGGTTGAASFAGANQIATLGSFSAQGFALNDIPDLSVAGPVQGGPSLVVTDAGALTVTGQAAAATIGLTGASIAIPGSVDGASAVNLVATTGIAAPGQVNTALLTATAGGSASFTGANAIGALGNLAAATLTLQDTSGLDVVGLVSAGTNVSITDDLVLRVASGGGIVGGVVGLTAPGIGIAGIVGATSELQLNAGIGGVSETGAIVAAELDGNAAGPVNLAGVNQVAAIGSFSLIPAASGTFKLVDTGALLLKGTLTSNLIVLDDATGQIILGDGAAIVTGGSARPAGAFKAPSQAGGGAFLTDLAQLGTSRATGIDGGPAVLDITAQNGGNIAFAPGSGGLYGPDTWLVLTLGNPGTPGAASGNVFIRALDVQYFGTGGSAALTGTVDGLGGQVAAGAANISPRTNAGYRFNACPIQSVNCVLLPTEGLPPINPLQNISIGGVNDTNPDDTLLLPIVSDRDY